MEKIAVRPNFEVFNQMSHCLVCEKELPREKDGIHYGCGLLTIEMPYGSKFDQLGYKSIPVPEDSAPDFREIMLLGSDEIRGYICDDCFEKKMKFLEGFEIKSERKWEQII
jgi:hypothetical protein